MAAGAIQTLLISDSLFRINNVDKRKRYVGASFPSCALDRCSLHTLTQAPHGRGVLRMLLLAHPRATRLTPVACRRRVTRRAACAALVDGVRDGGGEALVFSSMHVSGGQLNQLTGIAAILRFPLPDLEDAELPAEI